MQCSACLQANSRVFMRPLRRAGRCYSQSGRVEPFNEGAVQVKRLVNRDRKELLGNKIDILDKYNTEFGDPDDDASRAIRAAAAAPVSTPTETGSTSSSSSSGSSSVSLPFAASSQAAAKPTAPAAVQTKFTGSSSVSSPFGTSTRTRSLTEPKGLSPDMGPDPIIKLAPTPGNILSKITLTQVVLFCTFSSMILLMLATFSVVVKTGAVRLAGIE